MSATPSISCEKCLKRVELCVCEQVRKAPTRIQVLILQHPQESDKDLGTGRLTHLILENSVLKTGLSWPNLAKALGGPATNANWGVLFLGGKTREGKQRPEPGLKISNKSGEIFTPDEVGLQGIVALDGNWSQAKTLWWRNPWLLKLKRLVLQPARRSMYGELRREPRRECLSTLESIAETLEALGENPEASSQLRGSFAALLEKYRKLDPDSSSRAR